MLKTIEKQRQYEGYVAWSAFVWEKKSPTYRGEVCATSVTVLLISLSKSMSPRHGLDRLLTEFVTTCLLKVGYHCELNGLSTFFFTCDFLAMFVGFGISKR